MSIQNCFTKTFSLFTFSALQKTGYPHSKHYQSLNQFTKKEW